MSGTRQTDPALLEAFVSEGREEAFEALVHRYGGLVHGVCSRRLERVHDAEDASQAVFLILARKARALRRRSSLAGWLHRVATNVCLNARKAIERREAKQREVGPMTATESPDPREWEILSPVLDGELNRLAEKYRAPLILHHLEGLTKEEVAGQLGWNEGTVSSRLHRGRELLRARLVRRGVGFSAGLLTTLLADYASASPLPAATATSIVKAGPLVAAGKAALTGVASAEVAALTNGTIRTMLAAKVVKAGAAVLATGVLGAAVAVGAARGSPPGAVQGDGVERARRTASIAADDRPDSKRRRRPRSRIDEEVPPPAASGPGRGVSSDPDTPAPSRAPAGAVPPVAGKPNRSATPTGDPGSRGGIPIEGVITLFSLEKHGEFEVATFDFGHVVLEKINERDRDILYGRETMDPLTLALQSDDRGKIIDLGEREWSSIRSVDSLPGRKSGFGSPTVRARLGRMYLAHIKDSDSDFRVLFRVEELVPDDRCTLAWAVVDSRDVTGPPPSDTVPGPRVVTRKPAPRGPAGPARAAAGHAKAPRPVPFQVTEGTATLFARITHKDYEKATVSFMYGIRDDPEREITRNDWDVQFGNNYFAFAPDRFSVNMHGGDHCRIRSLGPMTWDQVGSASIPPLPVKGYTRQQLRQMDGSRVKLGHMYVVHIVDITMRRQKDGTLFPERQHDFYALFRVESHRPKDRCTISWKLINDPATGASPHAIR
jgi:RNA polymerase sigma factor (sigma-70 family)